MGSSGLDAAADERPPCSFLAAATVGKAERRRGSAEESSREKVADAGVAAIANSS